jgi:hypothetical protein
MMRFSMVCFAVLGLGLSAFAQIPADRVQELLPGTRVERLKDLAVDYEQAFIERKAQAEERALREGWPLREELEDGTIYELVGFEGNVPEYRITYNGIAAETTSTNLVYPSGGFGYDLTGRGMVIGEWDGGAVRLSHAEFNGRARQIDGSGSLSNHATHVAGTLMGGGARAEARGMAYEAELWAHDWNSDNAEMANAAAQGLLVSNHSYGTITGWANGTWGSSTTQPHWWGDPSVDSLTDYKFGWYNNAARVWDEIAFNAPYYLIVKSAGNDRSDNGPLQHYVFQGGSWQQVETFRNRDGGPMGYDCIPTSGNAKNILTIGAARGIPGGFTQPSDVVQSNFSSWGPSDDGRIKPDVVGNGVQLLSASSSGDNGYATLSGTSMSGPNVAGSLILLQQLYSEIYGQYMRAATLKGVAIHTADSATGESMPDYRNGWGMLNIKKGADVISQPFFHQVEERILEQGQTYGKILLSNGSDALKVTLSWTDVPGAVSPAILNNREPRLVNDLDVRLRSVEDSSLVFFPFRLNPEFPDQPATTGDNIVDNVEVIYAGVLPKGSYFVEVSHKGSLTGGSQPFSLITSSALSDCQLTVNERVAVDLPCFDPQAQVAVTIEEPLDGAGPFLYRLANGDFQEDNVFSDLTPGNYLVLVQDSANCVGVVNVSIRNPQPIAFSLEAEDRFHSLQGGVENTYTFSLAANNGWGGNPAGGLISGRLVNADDGSENPDLGCGAYVNGQEVQGNIALVTRGLCQFGTKALIAQQAGAKAVIIVNNEPGVMGMAGGNDGGSVNIPVYMVSNADGALLREMMEQGEVIFEMGDQQRFTGVSCPNAEDASVFPKILGGTPPYTVAWEDGNTSLQRAGLGAGVYRLKVTDQSGCEADLAVEVPTGPVPAAEYRIVHESCSGAEDGRLIITNPSQLSTYNFFLNGETSGINFSNLKPGKYAAVARNPQGCEVAQKSFTIHRGGFVPETEIVGPAVFTSEEPLLFTADLTDFKGSIEWSVDRGTVVSGQGTHQVRIAFDVMAPQATISLQLTDRDCENRVSTQVLANVQTSQSAQLPNGGKLKLYPVPAREHLVLEIESPQEGFPQRLEIWNAEGKLLSSHSPQPRTELSIGALSPGLYILHLGGVQMKFIKL